MRCLLLCDQTFVNADSLQRHYQQLHSPTLKSSEAVYGSTCPACGVKRERLAYHCSRVHHVQIAALFAQVRQEGDRRGVVVARVRALMDLTLREIEEAMTSLLRAQ
jgi:hypothetical protein